jgi:arylsulfatase A-like enzyme
MPHVPLFVSDKFKGKSERGLYGDVIMEIDWSVGRILDALRKNGLDRDTFVVFVSDNGPWLSYGEHAGSAGPLREGKGTTWEGGIREPCIMWWPGRIPAGRVCPEPAMTIDLFPTIAGLTGATLPKHKIDGLDIWPLISGQPGARNPHDAYFFYYNQNDLQAVLTDKWKLYFPHAYRTLAGRPGGKGGQPAPYSQARTGLDLYHLPDDIGETNNVAKDHPKIVARLAALAERAREDLGDNLTGRKGSGVRPPGRLPAEIP